MSDLNRDSLRQAGVKEISLTDTELAGRPAVRLDHAYPLGDIEHWASRSYFMTVRDTLVCLNMGTSDVAADRDLYDRIASSFRAIEDAVGIVLVRERETPDEFLVDLMASVFDYPRNRARQRLVQIKAQGESVVALVEAARADEIVQLVGKRSERAGVALGCRVAGTT